MADIIYSKLSSGELVDNLQIMDEMKFVAIHYQTDIDEQVNKNILIKYIRLYNQIKAKLMQDGFSTSSKEENQTNKTIINPILNGVKLTATGAEINCLTGIDTNIRDNLYALNSDVSSLNEGLNSLSATMAGFAQMRRYYSNFIAVGSTNDTTIIPEILLSNARSYDALPPPSGSKIDPKSLSIFCGKQIAGPGLSYSIEMLDNSSITIHSDGTYLMSVVINPTIKSSQYVINASFRVITT
ncbi:MAG: hypothetical protein RBR68_15795 [Tenuifilaceae bacterium]|nr:hypothetical protein [Tenuifilaceae bacterium]